MKKWSAIILVICLSGCATIRPSAKKNATGDWVSEKSYLESELQEKDTQIRDLENRLANYESAKSNSTSAVKQIAAPIKVINPSIGVNIKTVQKALQKSNYYKGVLDGEPSIKLKESIKSFQNSNGLKADGIVGPKTWEKLKRYNK